MSGEKRVTYRDGNGLEAKKWPSWPLAELAITVGVPGRDFLERPSGLLDLARDGFPRDVGENLVLVRVQLPDATLLEIRQLAEKQQASTSKEIQAALDAAVAEQALGLQVPISQRAPWDLEMPQAEKAPLRPLDLFITRDIFDQLSALAEKDNVSLSVLVELAWRQAHPFIDPRKAR